MATSTSDEDPIVSVLPVHFNSTLADNLHLHQFPLLARPLQVPPSAAQSGKKINARVKRKVGRFELHVPFDTRTEVWNRERGKELGQARAEDDQESGPQSKTASQENDQPRLNELRLRSEQVPCRCAYVLGIVRDGSLHLHPVNEVHQFRPTLTYMDVYMRKHSRRTAGHGSDSDSDDGPPPDPDEPASAPAPKKEKTRKSTEEVKEVHVSMKRSDDKGVGGQGGLSNVRRDMLMVLRDEDEEPWQDMTFNRGETDAALESFESVFSAKNEKLSCRSDLTTLVKDPGRGA